MEQTPSRLGNFVLVRLAAAGLAPSRTALDQTLKPYFACRLSLTDGQWRKLLAHTLEELATAGWIEDKPYQLTKPGSEMCARFLGITKIPTDCKWLTLRNRYLMAQALDVHPVTPAQWKRLASADGLRAAVIARHYQLPLEPLPTLTQVFQALADQHLPADCPRDQQEALLQDILIPNQPGDLKIRLPAVVMKAQNSSMESLRHAVINTWLNGSDAQDYHILQTSTPIESPVETACGQPTLDVRDFARQVQQLASEAQTGQFGDNKVFLSHLWENYRTQNNAPPMTREEFNGHLIEANRQNYILLSRADLISEMDWHDVEASEITLPHATFHFIRTDHAS